MRTSIRTVFGAKKTALRATLRLIIACATALTAGGAGAQTPAAAPNATASALPNARTPDSARVAHSTLAERAPAIDGRDDDAVWRAAESVTGFRVYDPVEDGDPHLRTEARVAHDARNLYVFVRAFDPRPDSIVALLSRRDVKTPSDQIKVMVDSYHDRRTGYEFAVNPAGVKRDYYTYDDASEDVSWDAVWEVATHVDSLGWTAEFRIPLSQLRFAAGARTFGLMLVREVGRTNERVAWPTLRRSRPGIASQFGELTGLTGLGAPQRLELAPYALTRNASARDADGYSRAQRQAIGADVKWGLTSNLTVDATVNPDFGQVEADPAVLNLTAFEVFQSERRPFFLEGTGIFRAGSDPTRLFYSRRIGRAPQLAGLVDDPTATIPAASTILGAAKLTGRLARGTSVGALGAVTNAATVRERVDDPIDDGSELPGGTVPNGSVPNEPVPNAIRRRVLVEPRTAFGVARVAQDFRGGESGVGLMLTGMRRDLGDSSAAAILRREAVTGGADLRHRFDRGRYQVGATLQASRVAGSARAIARTQRSGVHYYQRPDDALVYDSARTALTGSALNVEANKVSGTFRVNSGYEHLSPGFESNDVGFLSRADQQRAYGEFFWQSRVPRAFWRNATATLFTSHRWTAAGLPLDHTVEGWADVQLRSQRGVYVDYWRDQWGGAFCDRCAFGGPAVRLSPEHNVFVQLTDDPRRRVSPLVAGIVTVGDEGRSVLWRVRPLVRLRPAGNVTAELGARYEHNRNASQWVANVAVPLGTAGEVPNASGTPVRSYFAPLDQHTLGASARLDWTIRPPLSVQLYAEPFVSAGAYAAVRELAAPRAARWADRYRITEGAPAASDFSVRQFRSNAVLRWEYRPGSTVYVVWQQGRDEDDAEPRRFAAWRDVRRLFGARPDNTLLVKASYWLGR